VKKLYAGTERSSKAGKEMLPPLSCRFNNHHSLGDNLGLHFHAALGIILLVEGDCENALLYGNGCFSTLH